MEAGLLIQNAEAPEGRGSISSQRTIWEDCRCSAAAAGSLVVSCSHTSAWLTLATWSIQRRFVPKAKPTEAGPSEGVVDDR